MSNSGSEKDDQGQQDSESKDPGSQAESGGPADIGDDQLPEDLQPTDDNPLAKPPDQDADEDAGFNPDTDGGM